MAWGSTGPGWRRRSWICDARDDAGVITDWAFYAAAIPALLIAGMSKGGFGSGAAFAALPVMALAAPPSLALAVLLPILCAMDLVGLWAYWRQWDWRNVRALGLASVLGIVAGGLTFHLVNEDVLRLIIGVISLAFVGWSVARMRGGEPVSQPFSPRRVGVLGAVAGFTSFAAHAGGPLAAMALLPQRLDKTVYQATTVIVFWFMNVVKLVPYTALGLFRTDVLWTALVLLPLAPIGMMLGVRAHHRVSQVVFYRVIYALLMLTGLKLIRDGLT